MMDLTAIRKVVAEAEDEFRSVNNKMSQANQVVFGSRTHPMGPEENMVLIITQSGIYLPSQYAVLNDAEAKALRDKLIEIYGKE